MPTAAVIGASSLGSALIGANSAQRAASIQAQAARQAQANIQPFMIPGQGAMASLAQLYGINPQTGAYDPNQAFSDASLAAFQRSPDYQFALQSGVGALENSAAARGMLRSGSTLRGITQFGQDLASQQFGNYRGALGQLASIGSGAAGASGQAGMEAGGALASGIVGAGNAFSGALGSLGNYAMMQNQMQQQRDFLTGLYRPSSYTSTTAPFGNPTGFTAPTAPIGTGIWPT